MEQTLNNSSTISNNNNSNKRARVNSDNNITNECDSVKRLKETLLSQLDESDSVNSVVTNPDLDFFMKAFEEEILTPPEKFSGEFSGESPELGYLLEASDDELGLPPTELTRESNSVELNDLWGLENNETISINNDNDNNSLVVNYDDPFEYGSGYELYGSDGLFDYTDNFEDTVSLWRSEEV